VDFIDVSLRASHRLAWLLAGIHAAAIVAVLPMPFVWWLRLAGCAVLLASATALVVRRALLKAPDSIIRLRLERDGSCQMQMRDQRVIDGRLRPGWFASPLMIVLRVACPGQRTSHSITVLPDSADAESLRRLRIFLRFAVQPSIGKQ